MKDQFDMTNVLGRSGEDHHLARAFAALTAEDGEYNLPFRWQMRLLLRLLALSEKTGLNRKARFHSVR